MTKNLTLIILILLFFQTAKAQTTPNTVLYLMNNDGRIVQSKDSAGYVMLIAPIDSVTHLYTIKEYYLTGKPKLLGYSLTNKYNGLEFEGTCTEFFHNGRKKKVTFYERGSMPTNVIYYYPNGKLYDTVLYDNHRKLKLIACRDTTGNTLADGGNGKWLTWNESFTVITSQGFLKDSLKNGEWTGMRNDTDKYVYMYKNGEIQSGVSYDKSGKAYPFTSVYVSPLCTYGLRSLYNFLNAAVDLRIYGNIHGIKYPSILFSFDVGKDGKLNNVKILNGLDNPYYIKTFSDAVKKLPAWQPGKLYGINTIYTITNLFRWLYKYYVWHKRSKTLILIIQFKILI